MEKKQTAKEEKPKTESAAFDAKWMKHWEERRKVRYTTPGFGTNYL